MNITKLSILLLFNSSFIYNFNYNLVKLILFISIKLTNYS